MTDTRSDSGTVSVRREWLEHVIKTLQGPLPSGHIGDCVFLLRDQLQDILDAPSPGLAQAPLPPFDVGYIAGIILAGILDDWENGAYSPETNESAKRLSSELAERIAERLRGIAYGSPEPEAYRETVRRVAAAREKRMAELLALLTGIIQAESEFREQMGSNWEGDPLSDTIDAARRFINLEAPALPSTQRKFTGPGHLEQTGYTDPDPAVTSTEGK